jgi:hypothetical protein
MSPNLNAPPPARYREPLDSLTLVDEVASPNTVTKTEQDGSGGSLEDMKEHHRHVQLRQQLCALKAKDHFAKLAEVFSFALQPTLYFLTLACTFSRENSRRVTSVMPEVGFTSAIENRNPRTRVENEEQRRSSEN